MLWDAWWVWVSGALALATLEVIVPGYIFLGFAAGALCVGLILLVGIGLSLPVMLVAFAVLSLIAFLALRRVLGVRKGDVKLWTTDIND